MRQYAQLSQSGDVVDVEAFDPNALGSDVYLASMDLEVSFSNSLFFAATSEPIWSSFSHVQVAYWFEKNAQPTAYSADELQAVFVRAYEGLIFTSGQPLVFDFHGQNLRATVKGIHCLSLDGGAGQGGRTGILTNQTEVNFVKDPASAIKIKSSAKKSALSSILTPLETFLTFVLTLQTTSKCHSRSQLQIRRHGNRWSRF